LFLFAGRYAVLNSSNFNAKQSWRLFFN
jgi:hypothetical protein